MESTNKITCDVFPVICAQAGFTPDQCCKSRKPEHAIVRQVSQHIQRYIKKKQVVEIAELYNTDHGTISHNIKRVEFEFLRKDHPFSSFVNQCIKKFEG